MSTSKISAVSRRIGSLALSLSVLFCSPGWAVETSPAGNTLLLGAMRKELDRSMVNLKSAGEAPLYFLSYGVYDTTSVSIKADYGAIDTTGTQEHKRTLDVVLRVGSSQTDNTHKLREHDFDFSSLDFGGTMSFFPLDDDEDAIRTALWQRTDSAFRSAQEKYRKVKTNREVKVEEEDASDDFSAAKPQNAIILDGEFSIDQASWQDRLRKLSAIYKEYPAVQDSHIYFSASETKHYLVNSEGSNVQEDHPQFQISSTVRSTADDGMSVWLYDSIEAPSLKDFPDDATLEKMVRKLAVDLTQLRTAKRAEPFSGPAILRSKAAGVFFHEIFGHRIEGHRQKDEEEGRTFTKLVDHAIMPSFINVYDDPTRQYFGTKALNGYYHFDDEGVPAEKVDLVDKGILKSFLMSRSPVKGFQRSNGHGRSSPGRSPVARQGNLVVDSSKRVPYEQLREKLVAEIKAQGKPYGLIFDEIAGGFTSTQSWLPQSFSLLPLRVWRVYADGRPDELLRGVNLVGTPLTNLERILCAADDDDTFNGVCGAESGWVPVSATSPSLLIGTIEVERQSKDQEKPPLLPAPLFDKASGPNKQPSTQEGKK
jgi:predicted Zn-dependent protease